MHEKSAPTLRRRTIAVGVVCLTAVLGLIAAPALAATAPWAPPVTVTDVATQVVSSVVAPDGTITGTIETAAGIATVTSTDAGATWSAPVYLGSGGDYAFRSTIGVTSSGLLLAAWVEETAGIRELYTAGSSDQGVSWSTPTPLPVVGDYQDDPTIASTGPDAFTVAWSEDFDKLASASTDGGATWSSPEYLSQAMNSYGRVSLVPIGGDEIVAIFQQFDGNSGQFSIQSRRSTDGGLTWNAIVPVSGDWSGSFGNGLYAFGVSPSAGTVIAVWSRGIGGFEDGLFAATSSDSGDSWGAPITVAVAGGELRYFTVQPIDSTSAGIVWYYSGESTLLGYSTVAVGASLASSPVVINPDTTAQYDRLPSLSVLGDVRVVTWNQYGETDAANAYRVSASCDAGATWTTPSDLAIGEGLAFDDAASLVSGGVFTAFWGEYAPDFDSGSAFASSTDLPCTATAALAQTGGTTSPAALFVALALLGVGAIVLVARRRSAA